MDLFEDIAMELDKVTGIGSIDAKRVARELIDRGWITPRRALKIAAKRRYIALMRQGKTNEDARIDIESRYDLTEACSRMLIYRERNHF